MAAQNDHTTGDSADLSEHMQTWKQFTGLVKWSIAGIGVIMILLAIFRTHN